MNSGRHKLQHGGRYSSTAGATAAQRVLRQHGGRYSGTKVLLQQVNATVARRGQQLARQPHGGRNGRVHSIETGLQHVLHVYSMYTVGAPTE